MDQINLTGFVVWHVVATDAEGRLRESPDFPDDYEKLGIVFAKTKERAIQIVNHTVQPIDPENVEWFVEEPGRPTMCGDVLEGGRFWLVGLDGFTEIRTVFRMDGLLHRVHQ